MGQSLSQARLDDRYYLQKVKLGQGSFGTVWRAVDRHTNSVVAIKQLEKAAMPRRGVRKQDIEREINVMQAVSHDNITQLLGTFEDHSSIYLALEYCDGGDFGDKVKEKGLGLQESEAAEWMRQIISAIGSLHSKCICHRDIKPDNFMVHGDQLKLSDFGLALFLPRGRLLTEKCGTPAFMSPEQHKLPRFSQGYTNLCDVWAAGITMYMLMFGGRHPFLNSSQQLDEKRLLQGSLDFTVAQGFFGGFGLADARFSEAARRLCRKLVEPDLAKRTSAEELRSDPWLAMGGRRHSGEAPAPRAGRSPAPLADGRRARSANPLSPVDAVAGGAQGDEVSRGQSWWPFGAADENARPNSQVQETPAKGSGETEAELHKRIEALEEQVRGFKEQNESQWEALVHGKKVMQQLVQEKQKLADFHRLSEVDEGGVNGIASPQAPLDAAHRVVLQVGTRCRYNSSSWSGWMPAVVQGFNESDSTYNLDVRQHAKPENISPASDVPASEAWPPGTLVHYESSTVRHWLPAVIRSFVEGTNGGEGTYNLDVRECAQVDRMRLRLL
mmetsp:Transcript_24276/g.76322  ORF Transcript_24276/g.76322 Transcript_24276/m.76322 type:complete len:556 (-) Transcript_24276:101-1768(-)